MYFNCLVCPKLGKTCRPIPLALPTEELLKWCRKYKATHGLSNAKIAEITGVPLGTVGRVLARDYTDAKYETMWQLVSGLLGGFDDFSCPNADQVDEHIMKALELENRELKDQVKNREERHRKEKRLLFILVIVASVLAMLALTAVSYFLIYDYTHQGHGIVFW